MKKTISASSIMDKLCISQADLAAYLGVSRSHLSMNQIHRRSLPSFASVKLARLEMLHLNAGKEKLKKQKTADLDPALAQQRVRTKEGMLQHAAVCNYKKGSLQKKLNRIREQFAKADSWSNLLNQMQQATPQNKENKADRLWLEMQQAATLKKMLRGNPSIQAKLQVKIQVLEAEEAAYKSMAEKI